MLRCDVAGLTIRVPGTEFSLVRELYCRGVYAPRPEFLPRAGYTVVDLGANVGLFSVHAALAGARVIAVEAQSGFTSRFWRLMEMNGVTDNVTLRHALVGSSQGVLSDERSRLASPEWLDEAPTPTLDAILDDVGVSHVDLLKSDIEGSEFALFAEGPSWLDRVDRVVMEVHRPFGDPEDIGRLLEHEGFVVRRARLDLRVVDVLRETGFIHAVRSRLVSAGPARV
jgi:FkbM family methyltransferase